ncbi:C40 family peptidase [Streptomyces sp. NPDC048581]|uniref:C40 family peptidase n=1 Tax=Streptomyces sp. NPDC048581 TaxID=3365572 RepID=UPI00371653A3
MRNSALASAALTSVALLAQTANAAPSAGDETPSREEVSRRVSSLYDQAESDTGTFNATRAASTEPRKRADRPTDAGRGPAAARSTRGEESGRSDPALDSVTRQWFDAARSKAGPIVPAVVPRDRMPDGPTGARPARPAERALEGLTDRGREPSGRAALELPAAPVAELPAAPATAAAAVAELTAGPIAALPAAPEAAPPETGWTTQGTLGNQSMQSSQITGAALALPAPTAAPAADPQQSSLRTTKEQNQRKLDRARGLLSAYTTQQSTALTAIESPLGQPSPETQWQALQDLGASDLTPVPAGATAWPGTAVPPAGTLATTATAPQDTPAVRALDFALAQIGKPCVWGTTGPGAYDSGGLTQAAWKAAGITLPRTPQEQATAGRGIALTYIEPGDLVLFHAGHVGIYSGNGMMIHAPGPGRVIREESIHYAGESAIHSVIRPA